MSSAGSASITGTHRRGHVMQISFSGKTALVTGSTSGIGLAIARGLAEAGAETIINGRSKAKVDEAVAALKRVLPAAKLRGVAADVGNAAGCDALARSVAEVDIL